MRSSEPEDPEDPAADDGDLVGVLDADGWLDGVAEGAGEAGAAGRVAGALGRSSPSDWSQENATRPPSGIFREPTPSEE